MMRNLAALLLGLFSPLSPLLAADAGVVPVKQLATEVTPQVIQWRRDLHTHPELSSREQRTSRLVADTLRAMGVDEVRTGVAGHGVVGLIRGGRPGPCVGLRADMDALPVQEQTGLPFASQNPGVMHACGHDGHTSVLLGAAAVLVRLRPQLPGSVKLIFQPAEEGPPPGQKAGAAQMIAEGVLERPAVAAIFALHVSPELDAGKVSYRPGAMTAAVDRFRVVIVGRQSHAAMPWQGVDPILTAAHVITAIHTIASHRIDARQVVVVSVGIVKAGTAWNIIPGQAILEGTIRTQDPAVRRRAAEEFHRLVKNTAAAHGAQAQIQFDNGTPAVINDAALSTQMRPSLVRAVGAANLLEAQPMTGGEDFACYAEKVPGLFFFLGVKASPEPAGLHSPHFLLNEAALPVGVRTMALLAVEYLVRQAK
jgi:amidohydrolase